MLITSTFIFDNVVNTVSSNLQNILFSDDLISQVAVSDRYVTHPSDTYLVGYYTRWSLIGCVALLGFIFSMILLLKKRSCNNLAICSLFIGCISFSLALGIAGYGIYGMDRGYMFSIIPFSIIISLIISDKNNRMIKISRYISILFIIYAVMVFPVSKYASDPYNFVSDSLTSSRDFIEKFSPEEIQTMNDNTYNFRFLKSGVGPEYYEEIFRYNNLIYFSNNNNYIVI